MEKEDINNPWLENNHFIFDKKYNGNKQGKSTNTTNDNDNDIYANNKLKSHNNISSDINTFQKEYNNDYNNRKNITINKNNYENHFTKRRTRTILSI